MTDAPAPSESFKYVLDCLLDMQTEVCRLLALNESYVERERLSSDTGDLQSALDYVRAELKRSEAERVALHEQLIRCVGIFEDMPPLKRQDSRFMSRVGACVVCIQALQATAASI